MAQGLLALLYLSNQSQRLSAWGWHLLPFTRERWTFSLGWLSLWPAHAHNVSTGGFLHSWLFADTLQFIDPLGKDVRVALLVCLARIHLLNPYWLLINGYSKDIGLVFNFSPFGHFQISSPMTMSYKLATIHRVSIAHELSSLPAPRFRWSERTMYSISKYCCFAEHSFAYWLAKAWADCQILGSPGNIPIVLEASLNLDKCNGLQSTKHFINECWHCTFHETKKEESMALCPRSLQSKLGWQYRSDAQGTQREGWQFNFHFVLCEYRYREWQQMVKHLSPGPHGFSCPPAHMDS